MIGMGVLIRWDRAEMGFGMVLGGVSAVEVVAWVRRALGG